MTPTEFSERLWDFAVEIAKLIERLPDTLVGRHVAGQLLRMLSKSVHTAKHRPDPPAP